MPNYSQYFGDPVAELHPTVKIFAVDDNDGLPIRQAALMLTPTEGAIELPRGAKGEKGDKGDPARPFNFQGNASSATIATLVYGTPETGYSWRNTDNDNLHYWNGDHWIVFPDAFGTAGPPGPVAPIADFDVEYIDEAAEFESWITGSAGDQTLHLRIPERPGPQGPIGPTAAIATATDYDGTITASTGKVLTKLSNGKWGPGSANTARMYSIPEASFASTGTQFDSGIEVLCEFPLDQLSYASYLHVTGHFRVNQLSTSSLLVEVRVGNSTTGELIGRGLSLAGAGDRIVQVNPHFSAGTSSSVNTSPGAYRGLIPANHTGTAGTVYVTVRRNGGVGTWQVAAADAQLSILRNPA